MLKTIIVFPDGAELSSGINNANAIQNFSITECVNIGEELTIGSVCCNSIDVKIFTPSGEFNIDAGTEVTVYREDQTGTRHKVGVFVLDKPTRATANTMKVVGYDRISKLDKDLTAWLAEYDGWDIEPLDFAEDVCAACGLQFVYSGQPNNDYRITPFTKSQVSGRQLIKWIAELCCCFCRANADGNIEFAWYKENDIEISATGENYYLQNGLSYDDFVIDPIEMAQIRLADSENGVPWPLAAEGINSYIITGNPLMPSSISDPLLDSILVNIEARLETVSYAPCKVSIPANMNIHAGDILRITDKNGKRITCYVMTKKQEGLKDTLECFGSKRRDSTQAMNSKTQQEIADQAAADAASKAAADVLRKQTGEEIFNKLTNNGEIQGIYQQNGKWYINGEFAQVFNLVANYITSGRLQSRDQKSYFDLDSGELEVHGSSGGVSIKTGQLIYSAPDNKGTVRFGALSGDGGPLMAIGDTTSFFKGGFFMHAGEVWLMTNQGSGRLGKKTIHYKDENGNTQTEDFFVAY